MNEIGHAICQCRDGKIRLGPRSTGTSNRVSVKLKCPPGCVVRGVYHSHPSSRAYPSSADVQNLLKAGLPLSCIQGLDGLKCYHISESK